MCYLLQGDDIVDHLFASCFSTQTVLVEALRLLKLEFIENIIILHILGNSAAIIDWVTPW